MAGSVDPARLSAPEPADPPAASVRVLELREVDELRPSETAVVVDVLRATSTIAVALDRGAAWVRPVRSPAEARRVGEAIEDPLLVGERSRGSLEGFVDNSPATLAGMDLTGERIVLTTTNGTHALLACERAERVLAGGLVNASRLARELAGAEVALVAAGWEGDPADDDTACCRLLAQLLRGEAIDLAEGLERLEASTSARKLREHGKGDDVDLCLRPDAAPVVPELVDGRLEA